MNKELAKKVLLNVQILVEMKENTSYFRMLALRGYFFPGNNLPYIILNKTQFI